jgi:hypothetical protein
VPSTYNSFPKLSKCKMAEKKAALAVISADFITCIVAKKGVKSKTIGYISI